MMDTSEERQAFLDQIDEYEASIARLNAQRNRMVKPPVETGTPTSETIERPVVGPATLGDLPTDDGGPSLTIQPRPIVQDPRVGWAFFDHSA
jgi:hypothetical protein